MRIVQIMPTISFGDAVSNDAVAIKNLLIEQGFKTEIYAENIDRRLPERTAVYINKLSDLTDRDIVIYHNSTGTDINYKLEKYSGRHIMIYHNITPPEFFKQYSPIAERLTVYGLEGTKYLSDKISYCFADSNFNKKNLIDMGYKCEIDVRSILIPFDDYRKKPNTKIVEKYINDGWVNILFVGRFAPNKKQEDIIRAFHYYKKNINKKSRLFLVGSDSGMENYFKRLKDYVRVLGTEDVIFPGHIKFDEILAYYKIADVFFCMSEHEGFCVPLVEAMFFDVPIIAYNSSAISDTLGGAGILTNTKDPIFNARLIERCVNDELLRENLIEKGKTRLLDFSYDKIKEKFLKYLTSFIKKNHIIKG